MMLMLRSRALLFFTVALLAGGCSSIGDLPNFDSVPNPVAKDDSGRTKIDTMSEQAERHESDTLKEIEKR
ncbi:MAG: hypothetical protein ACAH24_29235 [Hyphomicrobiaceae bacterium]